MTDDLVKVKLKKPYRSYNGLCGFKIRGSQVLMCPEDVFIHGSNYLERLDYPEPPVEPEVVEKPVSKPLKPKPKRRSHYGKSKKY